MKIKLTFWILILPLFIYAQKQVKIDWPSLANSPWPVLRGDMQGTGRSNFIGPRTCNIAWKKDMPLGVIFGPVIGYDDVLYMGDNSITQDTLNYFYAVNKNSESRWTFPTLSFYANNGSALLARDSTIYFFSASRRFYALNLKGEFKWSIYSGTSSWYEFFLDKAGNIYLPGYDTLRVVSPSGIMKKYDFPEISSSLSFSVGGDTIYSITGGPIDQSLPGSLTASDLKGNVYWSYPFGGLSWGIPLVDNQNNIYVIGYDTLWGMGYLYCIKPEGTLKWRYPVNYFDEWNAPTMDHNGNIILYSFAIVNTNTIGSIISLDHNGNKRWVTTLEGDFFSNIMTYGLVCDAEGKIYCGSNQQDGNFYCIDSNGVILWKTAFPYMYDSCPAIGSDGTLYIGTHGSSLFRSHVQNLIAIKDSVTSINDIIENVKEYKLNQNYPNPFNPSTVISYSLASASNVKLDVFNSIGSKVATLVNEYKPAGNYKIQFNGSNLASGIYLYRLESRNFSAAKKFILMK